MSVKVRLLPTLKGSDHIRYVNVGIKNRLTQYSEPDVSLFLTNIS